MVSAPLPIEPGPHKGRCHCGGVRFTAVVPENAYARRCNCSICTMKGVVMIDVPLENLTVDQGKDLLALYTFGSGEAKHRFCSRCGIHCFHQTRSDPDKYGLNGACIEDLDLYEMAEVPVFDGRNHPGDNDGVGGYAGIMRFEPDAG